jgi:hypothetical protein
MCDTLKKRDPGALFNPPLNLEACLSDIACEHPLNHQCSSQVDPMPGPIALSVLSALITGGCVLLKYRGRRNRQGWRLLRDLSPVSGQWLADFRRGR